MNPLIEETISQHQTVVKDFLDQCSDTIDAMGNRVVEALRAGGKICFFGNGGSAADAQHFSTEFVVRFVSNRKGLPAIAFTTDSSILTACANDFGYHNVFARQVEALCEKNDIVVGISTSGTSKNVVEALRLAKEMGIGSFAFTGEAGAQCEKYADLTMRVPSTVTARIQECHLIGGHIICDIAERAFLDRPSPISGVE